MPDLHFVKEEGQGPVLVLSHALGLDLHMWDGVVAALRHRFTIIRYDHRGHGKSSVPQGPYSVEMLADDAAKLIRMTCQEPVHFVGLSLGGMTAQALAASAPELLASICIVNSTAHYPDRAPWEARMAIVRKDGVSAIAEGSVNRWVSPTFHTTPTGVAVADRLYRTLVSSSPDGYVASCAAIAGMDFRETNRRVTVPTLVVAGTQDLSATPAMGRSTADMILGAEYQEIDAAHISAMEQPAKLAEIIECFVGRVSTAA